MLVVAYQYEKLYVPGPAMFTQSFRAHSVEVPLSVSARARESVRPVAAANDADPTADQ